MMMEKLVEMVDSVPWLRAERAMKQPNNDQPGGGRLLISIGTPCYSRAPSWNIYIPLTCSKSGRSKIDQN